MTSGRGFVGRSDELDELKSAFRRASGGDGAPVPQVVAVVGESGFGKTRLVQELYLGLTQDPEWDPPEWNYWPDAFGGVSGQLRVNPEMATHECKGPPKFFWLGMRWHDQEERNLNDRVTALPELTRALDMHRVVIRRFEPIWTKLKRVDKVTLGKQVVCGVSDFLGMGWVRKTIETAETATKFLSKMGEVDHSIGDVQRSRQAEARNKLIDDFRELLSDSKPLPIVLWLDDGQWIDQDALNFIRELWEEAVSNAWPLMVVLTHWEAEWRALKESSAEGGVWNLTNLPWGQEGQAREIILGSVSDADLTDYVRSRLPGLTPEQTQSVVAKGCGNYLAMAENVTWLCKEPMNFVGKDINAALSPAGERRVKAWESSREKRVESRFSELDDDCKLVLGWGAKYGVRFPVEFIERIARAVGREDGAEEATRTCIHRLGILVSHEGHVLEFRDRLYAQAAIRHFDDYRAEEVPDFEGLIRSFRIGIVNQCFDAADDHELVWGKTSEDPTSSWIMTSAFRADLLAITTHLWWQMEAGLADGRAVSSDDIRCLSLHMLAAFQSDAIGVVERALSGLDAIQWDSVPENIVAPGDRFALADIACEFGLSSEAALVLRLSSLRLSKMRAERLAEDQAGEAAFAAFEYAIMAGRCGWDLWNAGRTAEAGEAYEESFTILRQLFDTYDDTDAKVRIGESLSYFLSSRAELLRRQGSSGESEALHLEGESLIGKLLAISDSSLIHRCAAQTQTIFGNFLFFNGDCEKALHRYTAAVQHRRELAADSDDVAERFALGVALFNLGQCEAITGPLDSAISHTQESKLILEAVANEAPTARHRLFASCPLETLAVLALMQGDEDQGLVWLQCAWQMRQGAYATPAAFSEIDENILHLPDLLIARYLKNSRFSEARDIAREMLALARRIDGRFTTPSVRELLRVALRANRNTALACGDRNDAMSVSTELVEASAAAHQAAPDEDTLEELLGDIRGHLDLLLEGEQDEEIRATAHRLLAEAVSGFQRERTQGVADMTNEAVAGLLDAIPCGVFSVDFIDAAVGHRRDTRDAGWKMTPAMDMTLMLRCAEGYLHVGDSRKAAGVFAEAEIEAAAVATDAGGSFPEGLQQRYGELERRIRMASGEAPFSSGGHSAV